ncbi:MAG: 5'-deoxyadenosine deaminase [Ignavibacteriales bacterium]|nr:MAG: 5'-deoxyadenosine deaminase [Ignavibacteriales bacterium]
MIKTLLIPHKIVTVNSKDEILTNHAVEIEDRFIRSIINLKDIDLENYDGVVVRYPNYTLIPGFVQTHIHLCQTLFRGLADDLELLDWLQQRIFPYENAHSKESLRISAKLGINELQTGGTTTILDMGTIRHHEQVMEELISSGMRAISGKCMVDENDLMPQFKESIKDSINSSVELANEFHNSAEGRVKYGFAPRFVLSCSEKLLKETVELTNQFEGSVYHTHSSENKNEVAEVRRKFSKENIDYFNSIGVLGNNTVLAHCIHTNENEINLLKHTGTKISHCPSSNLKLGSGIANIPEYIKRGISVSLGADGAPCNNNLSAFTEMRLAALIQKPLYGPTAMDAKTVFKLATIEGAKALHLEEEIGSVEAGKKADLVLIDLETPTNSLDPADDLTYSNIVYTASKENVKAVMIDGEWVVKNGESLVYDPNELVSEGRTELHNLIDRV